MFFADEGRVYKVVQWYNDEGVPGSALLDIFDIMPGLPITAMEISKKVCPIIITRNISSDHHRYLPPHNVALKNTTRVYYIYTSTF